MDGGDANILSVAFSWTGISGALPFAILLGLFSGAHSLAAKLGLVKSEVIDRGRLHILRALPVAATLMGTFMLRSLQLVWFSIHLGN